VLGLGQCSAVMIHSLAMREQVQSPTALVRVGVRVSVRVS